MTQPSAGKKIQLAFLRFDIPLLMTFLCIIHDVMGHGRDYSWKESLVLSGAIPLLTR